MRRWVTVNGVAFSVKVPRSLEEITEERQNVVRLRALTYDVSNDPEQTKAAIAALENILFGGKDGTISESKVEGPQETEISRVPRCVR